MSLLEPCTLKDPVPRFRVLLRHKFIADINCTVYRITYCLCTRLNFEAKTPSVSVLSSVRSSCIVSLILRFLDSGGRREGKGFVVEGNSL